ncbi:MAG TPA: ABC transporter permease [bacterium]|nr:ABC transporter permease [bacterium]
MFYLSYLRAELLRRFGKTVTIALGLSIASAIIITIVSVSQSLQASQETVLNPLSNVGTDMLVTRTVSADNMENVDEATREDMMADNRVFTDLASLGEAGDQFSTDTFAAGGNLTFEASEAEKMDTSLVADHATGLLMNVTHQEGTIPTITATFRTGGQTYSMTRIMDMELSDEEMEQMRAQMPPPGVRSEDGDRPTFSREFTMDFTVPEEDITQNVDIPETDIKTSNYTIAGVDITNLEMGLILPDQIIEGAYFTSLQAVTSPNESKTVIESNTTTEQTDTDTATSNVTDTAVPSTEGSAAETADSTTATTDTVSQPVVEPSSSEAIISQAYAQKQGITLGSTLTIKDTTFTVVGIVSPQLYTNTADVYVTLPVLQELSGKTDRVNVILVKSTDAASVDASTAALESLFTGATVTSSADTAEQVSGSLLSVTSLMNEFVGLVSIIVLIAAFVIVSLITVLSVNKRVREIGTLKAFGWSNFKIIRQIVLENFVLGILGAGIGIGIAVLAIYGLNHAGITLDASIASLNSSLGGMVGRFMGGPGMREASSDSTTDAVSTTVALQVTYSTVTLLIGSLVAIVGSLFAGLVASFKAARMRPQEALRNLE